jgi:uncharacterized protein (UPF0303 family)
MARILHGHVRHTTTVPGVPAVTDPADLLEQLAAQEERLQFDSFTNDDAITLGLALVEQARRLSLAVTVDVRRGDQQLFHAALEGTSADNDAWVERKVRVVRRFAKSSMRVGTELRAKGRSIEEAYLLDGREFAAHGGAFPVVVRDVGLVGVVTVSGLPQEQDHQLVVDTVATFLGTTLP